MTTVLEANRKEHLKSWLSKLSSNERNVIALRFGLETDVPETLDSIGTKFGITRERVRQIESQALNKLREFCRSESMTLEALF